MNDPVPTPENESPKTPNENSEHVTSESGEESSPVIKPLRIWPAILLVILMWALRIVPGMMEEPTSSAMMARFMGPCVIAFGIVLWWAFFSRATGKEKWIGILVLSIIVAISTVLMDKTFSFFGTIIFAAPWGMTAFTIMASLTRKLYPARTVLALVAALLVFGYWDLIRADAYQGDFEVTFNWRWEPTPEEAYLQDLADQDSAGVKREGFSEPLAEPEWAGFRGANRTGEQPDVVLVEDWKSNPPKELWRIQVGPGWSSFSVAGDRLFTQQQRGDQEVVVCYSAKDGKELWVHQDESRFWEAIGGAGPRGTPTIADGSLFTLGANGVLNRLDAVTGKPIWKKEIQKDAGRTPPTWGFASSPLVTHGLVIVHAGGEGDKGLLAYDQETGDLRWSAPAGNHSYSSPQLSTVDGQECILILTNNGLKMVSPEDGRVLGEHIWPFDMYRVIQPLVFEENSVLLGTPMSDGTRLIQANWDGEKYSIEEVWTSKQMKPYFNDYVLHKGYLYGFDNNIFACVNVADGKRKWKRGRYGNGQVILLPKEDQLLVISEKGELVLLRATPEKFEELGKIQILEGRSWNHPVVVGNRLFVRNGEEAACFELAVK